MISQDNTPRKRSTRWFHTRIFSLPAYLTALLVGYYTGVLGHIFAAELFTGYRLDYNELVMVPITAAVVFAIAALEILPKLAWGSILMVPATMVLLALARRFKIENPFFAALFGMPVAAIFAIVLEMRPGENFIGADLKELIGSVFLGGVCAGLAYWAWLKTTGLLPDIAEEN